MAHAPRRYRQARIIATMSSTANRTTDGFRPASLALATVGLCLGTFMQVLDISIANVSLPTIAGNLAASQDQSTWVITRSDEHTSELQSLIRISYSAFCLKK